MQWDVSYIEKRQIQIRGINIRGNEGVEGMMIEELYSQIGGDYEGVLRRFGSEERILKYIRLFIAGDDYNDILTSLECGDAEKGLLFAHNLKGVGLNLGLTGVWDVCAKMCESLREGEACEKAMQLLPQLKKEIESIKELVEQL